MKLISLVVAGALLMPVAAHAGVTDYKVAHVSPFANTVSNHAGAWVDLRSATFSDGTEIKTSVQFEISARYDRYTQYTIGFAQYRTGIEFPARFARKRNMGFRYFVNDSAYRKDFSGWLQSMSFEHANRIRAVCGLLADRKIARDLTERMARMNSSNPRYFQYWTDKRALAGVVRQGERCISAARRVWPDNRVALAFLQTELARLGLYHGEIDGVDGPNTRAAVRQAQALYLLPSAGVASLTAELRGLEKTNPSLERVASFVADNAAAPAEPVPPADAREKELERQLAAANKALADLKAGTVPASREAELQRQLNAANATIADLREGIESNEEVARVNSLLAAANATIADLRATTVPANQLAAANATVADLRETTVTKDEFAGLRRNLDAANATIADLTDEVAVLTPRLLDAEGRAAVLDAELSEAVRQRDALNRTMADMETNMIARTEYQKLRVQLDAANVTVADLREEIETEHVPLLEHENLRRQIAALNETVTVLQERSEKLKARWLDAQRSYDAFREECAAEPLCRSTMELDGL